MDNPVINLLKNFHLFTLVNRAVSLSQPDNLQIELQHVKKTSLEDNVYKMLDIQ